jgi:hypothetical protein
MLINSFPPLRIAAVISLLLVATPSAPAFAACIADWSIAAPIVHKEGLATVEALSRLAQAKISGNIVKTTLCEEDGGLSPGDSRSGGGCRTARSMPRFPFGR